MHKLRLSDYDTDIQKCSKCGICMSVCPVFKATMNECALSRGKFIMLNGVINKELKFSKTIDKYLDLCLKCNACKDFCPTNIDARKIFTAAKIDYFMQRKNVLHFCAPFLFEIILKILGAMTNIYRIFKLDEFVEKIYPFFSKFYLGRKIIFVNKLLKSNFSKRNSNMQEAGNTQKKQLNVVYFKGCVNEYVNPSVKNASEYILKKMGVNIIPVKFKCCAAPILSEGDVETFKKLALYNILQIPDNIDYFLTDCATCQETFLDYENYIDSEKLKLINEKSMNINEFVIKNLDKIKFKKLISFTFHKPCHLKKDLFLEEFIKKCDNIKYKQMKNYDECCGFSGSFAIKNREISEKISQNKVQNALNTNADCILTSCPACVMGLNQGLIELGEYKKNAINLIEFIATNIL